MTYWNMTLAIICLIFSSYFASVLSGWIYSVEEKFCYQIVDAQPKSWQAAREYCQQNGGDLLSISGVTEQNFIEAVLSKGQNASSQNDYWVGARDQSIEGRWNWTDNTPFMYSKWHKGEPNNLTADEDCAEIKTNWTYEWNDALCSTTKQSICKKNCLCGLGWVYSVENIFCYQIDVGQSRTWQAAREYCQQNGGDLLSISDITEQNFVEDMLSSEQYDNATVPHRYWIGATDNSSEGNWSWTDNTPFWYLNWYPGEPSNKPPAENCAEMIKVLNYSMYRWNDINCTDFKYPRGFICKKTLRNSNVSACDIISICMNTSGSFTCQCTSGYSGNGLTCTDVDECKSNASSCDVNAICTNTVGSYTCQCKSGYTGNGKICTVLSGWIYSVEEKFCYQIVDAQPKSWQAAREYCQQNGGDLLSISRVTEQNFIEAVLSKGQNASSQNDYWVGATDQSIERRWNWTDNTPFMYSKWHKGEPNNLTAGEDCAEIKTSWTYEWNDALCSTTKQSICKKNCMCGFGWVYSVENNFCYQIDVRQPKTWQAAREYCQQNGGDLLSISGVTEQKFVENELLKGQNVSLENNYWIGATDRSTEGNWSWTDNTPFVYPNWRTGEPNNLNDEDCAEIRSSWTYKWNDAVCNTTKLSICKKNLCTSNFSACDINSKCMNTSGSFTCKCTSGYSGDGLTCTDADECKANASSCDGNALCTNTVGSYTCQCKSGYTGNGKLCTDAGECKANASSCDVNALCTNTVGSYTCQCKSGYTGNGKLCTDADECKANASSCDVNALCTNTVGSYTCQCKSGYTGNGKLCTHINECISAPCHNGGQCIDGNNSYTCACTAGFSGISCDSNINECISAPCHNGDQCIDGNNSYTCACTAGFSGISCDSNFQERIIIAINISSSVIIIVIICSSVITGCLFVRRLKSNNQTQSGTRAGESVTNTSVTDGTVSSQYEVLDMLDETTMENRVLTFEMD